MRILLSVLMLLLAPGLCLGETQPADATPTPNALRLGTDVVPTFQSIDLKLDAREADYSGSVHVELEARKATDRFQFHAEGLTLAEVVLRDAAGAEVQTTHAAVNDEVVEVQATAPLAPGKYTLDATFTNPFDVKAISLYRFEENGEAYSFTQFEVDDAREAFPCWDEPSFKIPYQVTLRVPEEHLAVSNMPAAEETVADGWRTVVFEKSPPMSSYLLAIATGPFDMVEVPGLGVPGRIVTRKGKGHLTDLAVEVTPPILKALEEYFGSPYPYAKLDQIAVPEFLFGAMENPGAVVYQEGILVKDTAAASIGARRGQASVIAHELAHMWFGDVVTMQWWDDLWLNESFATWVSGRIMDQLYPELGNGLTEVSGTSGILGLDARATTKAMRQPVTSTKDVFGTDLGLAYTKGRSLLDMYEAWMGEEVTRKAVLAYIEKHAWGNATAADLMASFDKVSGKKVSDAMLGFLDRPGFPLVRVEILDGGKVRLRQERFRNVGAKTPDQTWALPVSLRYAASCEGKEGTVVETFFLDTETKVVELDNCGTSPDWVFPNAGATGYYRWQLDAEPLDRLVRNAADVLAPRERIEFLGNARALLGAGVLHGDQLLDILATFADDSEPLVVRSALGGMSGMDYALVPDELEDAYARYLRRHLDPVLERFGMEKKEGEDETVTMLRPSLLRLLGDKGEHPEVRAYAQEMAREYLEDPTSADPNLIGLALAMYVEDGDKELYEDFKKRFETAETPALRNRFLGNLGRFDDPELREATLRYALEGPVRPNELFNVVGGLGSDDEGRELLSKWMQENFDAIAEHIPRPYMAYLPFFMLGGNCSVEKLEKAKEFFSVPERQVEGTLVQLEKATESTHDCVSLREREGEAVARYLKADG